MRYDGFVGPAFQSRSPNVDSEHLINLIPELVEGGTPASRTVFYRSPGRAVFATPTDATGTCRGLLLALERVFAVIGDGFYEVLSTGTTTRLGTVADDTLPVSLATNGTQIGIVSGGVFYLYSPSVITPLVGFAPLAIGPATVTSPTLPFDGPASIHFLDGYFLIREARSRNFWFSALNDGLTWDALDFQARSQSADLPLAALVNHREFWLFGGETTQVFFDSGDADNPFLPNPSAFIEQGILAPASVGVMDETVLWLGATARGGAVVWRTTGYHPNRVSTHALEFAFQGYSRLDDAIAYTYQEDGHPFYVLTFPTAGKTWAYDGATGLWHERGTFTDGIYGEDRARCHVFAFGQHLVGVRDSTTIYTQSLSLLDDAGTPIRRVRRAPHLNSELQWLFYDQFQLDLQPGAGLVTGQGRDPLLMLRYSDDGGHTWSSEHTTTAGALGSYGTQAIWRQLGRSRNRVFEVALSDPVDLAWAAAYLRVTPGSGAS